MGEEKGAAGPGSADKKKASERAVDVKTKDMPDNIFDFVVERCQAFKDLNDVTANSDSLKTALDASFNKNWNVIMGKYFAGTCTVEKGYFLQMAVGDLLVLVFRSGMEQ